MICVIMSAYSKWFCLNGLGAYFLEMYMELSDVKISASLLRSKVTYRKLQSQIILNTNGYMLLILFKYDIILMANCK